MSTVMHRDDRASGLTFLLSLPLLATACPGGDDEGTTNDTSLGTSTDASTSNGSTETGTGTSTSNGSADTGTSNGSAETSTSNGGADTGDTDDTTAGGYSCQDLPPLMGPVSQACIDFTAKSNECYNDGGAPPECIAQYEAYCQYYIEVAVMFYGEACGVAYEDFYACLSMLTCEMLGDEEPDCAEQETALEMACVEM